MLPHIGAHELPKHLRGGLVLGLAGGEELLTQIALNPDAKPHVLHDTQCSRWIHIWVGPNRAWSWCRRENSTAIRRRFCHKRATRNFGPGKTLADFCGLRRIGALWQEQPKSAVSFRISDLSD